MNLSKKKKKKIFKDPVLREIDETKKLPRVRAVQRKPEEAEETFVSRSASNKSKIKRLMPKTRLELPTAALRSARTLAQCPSMSVVSNQQTDRHFPVVCSRSALNFHEKRFGSVKRVDNEFRLGQIEKRRATKLRIDPL